MSFKPMNDGIFGEVIYEEGDRELVEEFQVLSAEFINEMARSKGTRLELERAARGLTTLAEPEPTRFLARVTEVGPDCREVVPGDVIVVPLNAGSMVTIVEDNEPKRVFVISESVVLARYREDV